MYTFYETKFILNVQYFSLLVEEWMWACWFGSKEENHLYFLLTCQLFILELWPDRPVWTGKAGCHGLFCFSCKEQHLNSLSCAKVTKIAGGTPAFWQELMLSYFIWPVCLTYYPWFRVWVASLWWQMGWIVCSVWILFHRCSLNSMYDHYW